MRRLLFALALLATPVLASPVLADAPFEGCFLRRYDSAHLARHPDQLVTAMALRPAPEAGDGIILSLYVEVRGGVSAMGTAYCDQDGEGMTCGMEGDAGAFSLLPDERGIKLAVARSGVSFEGERDWVTLSGTTGDDRVFLLRHHAAPDCLGIGGAD